MTELPAPISDDFIADVVSRLGRDLRVRRFLPDGGRLHLDRRLPFLCVYRRPVGRPDPGTEKLISAEAATLITSDDPKRLARVRRLVRMLLGQLSGHFGAVCVVEVWADPDLGVGDVVHPETGEPVPPLPRFSVRGSRDVPLQSTVDALARSLQRVRVGRRGSVVALETDGPTHPPGMKPLVPPALARRLSCSCIGLAVRPVYRDPVTCDVYPRIVRTLRREVGNSLKRAFFAFACQNTRIRPQHYYSLGRRSLLKVVWEVDRRLAEIDSAFDLLLLATPVNAEAAWREFQKSGFARAPAFLYRPLNLDPASLKRRLFEVPIERVEDPTLAHLFREKQDDLDRRLTMLGDIGTANFLLGSQQVYGGVSKSLVSLARRILAAARPGARGDGGRHVTAAELARRAVREIDTYRRDHPGFDPRVEVRDDVYSGLLVSQGSLLIGRQTRVPVRRVHALLQHEVGTHLVTGFNGRAQPFRQLDVGLAGYDELQEGLAVLSELFVGGLDRPRLRLLAARVLAVEQLLRGAPLAECFRLLSGTHGFTPRQAYTIAMRVYRAGGLTKDVVYLRGFVRILEYLREGGDLDPLVVGKISAESIPIIRELMFRDVLRPPPLRPRYLDAPAVAEKLGRIRAGHSVLQLVQEAEP